MMKKTYYLPEGFLFGSSSSAWQTEGWSGKKEYQRHYVDMMYLKEPERWYKGIGTITCTDFYNRFEEDIQLMKKIGIQVYRTSIDWSRFIKNYETNEVDEDAVNYYHRLIDCLLENDIEPMICLEHWEIPQYLIEKYGNWENRKVMELFIEYGKKVIDEYHEKVKYWWTINEPTVVPECGYLYGEIWPYLENCRMFVQMNHHRVIATASLIKYFKEKKYDGKIGIILNPSPAYPKSEYSDLDKKAAHICELFNYRLYTDPLINGKYTAEYLNLLEKHNISFEKRDDDFELIKDNSIMILGLNYYQPLRVRQRETGWNKDKPFLPTYYYETFRPRGVRVNFSRGWEIYPKGIYDTLKIIQNEYGNIECFITENGMGVENEEKFKNQDGTIQDDYRIEFISEHLSWVLKAIDEGANCKGYLNWTFTDNLSPVNGFKNRYGFVEIDLNKNRNRRIKKSGYWVQKLMKERKFESIDLEPEYK